MKKIQTMRILIFAIVFIFDLGNVHSQSKDKGLEIDEKMLSFSQSHRPSVNEIVEYIQKNYTSKEDQLRASYSFVCQYLDYDAALEDELKKLIENKDLSRVKKEESYMKALKTKRGVCQHYADLFDIINKGLGFASEQVHGLIYNEIDDEIFPHVWNAVKISHQWFLFDPTYGSNYLDKNTGVRIKEINLNYYMQENFSGPDRYPYMPMWQLRSNPFLCEEFVKHDTQSQNHQSLDYKKSISSYSQQDSLQKIESLIQTLEMSKSCHPVIDLYCRKEKYNHFIKQFNAAINNLVEFSDSMKVNHARSLTKYKDYSDDWIASFYTQMRQKLIVLDSRIQNIKFKDNEMSKNFEKLQNQFTLIKENFEASEKYIQSFLSIPPENR